MTVLKQQMQKAISTNPIQDMTFRGLHWIEASAGTGKTYTLSSLMVRIFLDQYYPHQVIATTFTRKATAELKNRVRLRVEETLAYIQRHQQLNSVEIAAKIQSETDPLFQQVLKDYGTRMDYARRRLRLVLNQLDELFVGTLDSFSQKLLREFAFESGKIERAELTEDQDLYIQQLIHDVLRDWIQQQPQYMVNHLYVQNLLKPVEHYTGLVRDALNFSKQQFQKVEPAECDLGKLEACITQLLNIHEHDLEVMRRYCQESPKYFHKSFLTKLTDVCENFMTWSAALKTQGGMSFFDAELQPILLNLCHLRRKKTDFQPTTQVFNKSCPEAEQQLILQHSLIVAIDALCEVKQDLDEQLKQLTTYLEFHIIQSVQTRLPQTLQQQGETTFSQQIRTLAEALQGQQGQRFAQFVQARYPLILVDEFQDTNQDQDDLLAKIWRDASRVQSGCMIMVGDPKQAIYGFRGGDMLTYNKAHADVRQKQGREYTLMQNHRSVKALVEVVDALFQCQMDFGEQVQYTLIQAGSRPHPDLIDSAVCNPQPLRWIQLGESDVEADQVAWKIRALLNQSAQQQLYFQQQNSIQSLKADDIAVLGFGHFALEQVKQRLQRMGIPCYKESKQSVFASAIAQDVAAVLTAIMDPFNESKVKRALLTRLLGFNLKKLIELQAQSEGLSRYIADLDAIREMWFEKGFLTAWNYALNLFQVWTHLVASQSLDNERVVVNLRHLTEILSQQSEYYQGAQKLYHWYLRQLQSPSGKDSEKERKLSGDHGVQLMTIHASKGLEFKVVFLLGADAAFDVNKGNLNFSLSGTLSESILEQSRVIAVNHKHLHEQAILQNAARNAAENHRLWYVALTRASHRVYAMLQDHASQSDSGLAFWRGQGDAIFEHALSLVEQPLSQEPARLVEQSHNHKIDMLAQPLPERQFYPRTKTSFTALSQHQSHAPVLQDDLVNAQEHPDSAADEINLNALADQPAVTPLDWIKLNFPKGTVAGTFLHSIFEHINFQDSSYWNLEIRRRFKNTAPQIWQELKEKFEQAFQLRTVLEQTFAPHYQAAAVNLRSLFQAAAQANFKADELQQSMQRVLSSLNYKLLSGIRLHDQSQAYRQQWRELFQSAQQDRSALMLFLSQFERYFTELDDDSFILFFEQEMAQIAHLASPEQLNVESIFQTALDGLLDEIREDILLNLMHDWVHDILVTPIQVDFVLAQLGDQQYLSEFPFYLSLTDAPLQIRQIHQLFVEHDIVMSDFNEAKSARYLTGSIDLVYFDGQRYHIADYKSNFLGPDQQHYTAEAIQQNMSQSSYWLQAALYLVALHRYLNANMQAYSMQQHLGGASYLYLRGMHGQMEQGVYHWQPDIEFVEKLDQILGYFEQKKTA
ncbi:UvrD-helicase domain-containing protein [Acinetobacter pseudolwoffii]|uniref:UvrD-helicase domain-containing protein n=1 Tax=Acinetobacter pseudolwoffii TaxID=2053287 RepID=UPI002576CBC6|nr:UvrD-helicase domain-containing protein [Acinetobacter pseudolwoffii]MDM1322709.1 UvrD-helicase domain-containing protein [Acinetobacter pseudolwoffii]